MQSITDKRSVIGIKGAAEKINGSYYVKAGELNAPHIESKHYDKGTDDRTETADLYYYVHTDDQKIAHIYLGNNGRLRMKPSQKTGILTISKVVSGDADAENTEWSFTVTLKDENGKPLTGSYSYTGGTVEGIEGVTKPDDGTLTLDGKGQATFTLKHGQTITLPLPVGTVYEVAEQSADGYETTSTGTTGTIQENQNSEAAFTNTQLVSISGKKIWEDNNNQDGKRPESLKVYLYADYGDGKLVKVDEQTVTPPASGNPNEWTWTFQALPKYHNGKLIQYSMDEENLGNLGYHADSVIAGQDSDGGVTSLTITNKYNPEKTSITVRKIWNDDDNRDGIRPASITVNLLADGKQVQTTTLPNSEGRWIHTFQDLDKYKNGEEITYTVEEVGVDGYTSVISEYDADTGYTITNSHTPETVAVSGSKTWNDDNNRDGLRPESITIHLYADGEPVEVVNVTADDGWKWNFTNLPKYTAGKEISYTITEDQISGYQAEIDGMNVINRYTPERPQIPEGGTPKTGDGVKLTPWIMIFAISGIGLWTAFVLSGKKRQKQNKGRDLK